MANNIDKVSFSMGENTARQSTNRKDTEVNVKPPTPGFAKASPVFKEIVKTELPTEEEQKKTLANNTLFNKKKKEEHKKGDEEETDLNDKR